MADYKPVTYFDRITLDDLFVCEDCGALVHPACVNKHDIEHEWATSTVERLDHLDLGTTPGASW
jgi:hypothetical protein